MNGGTRVLRLALGISIAVLLMAGAEELVAQRRGAGGQRQEMEQRIQARFDGMVRDQLGLSDEQVESLQDVVVEFRRRRVEFSESERNVRGRVTGLGRGGGGRELTEEEATEILREMRELSGEEASIFQEEQEALLGILTAPQVVRYIMMRQQLGDRMRGLRGRVGPPRGPQGGRGPGIL